MKVHALQTGSVMLREAFVHARTGWRRRPALLVPGRPWVGPMPIHAWLIEHGDERILVDTGERADPNDPPFSRSTVETRDELPGAFEAAGLSVDDVTSAVVTHMHPDHYSGAGHLDVPVAVAQAEWDEITSRRGRILQRLTGAPLPDARFAAVALDGGAVGAFSDSRPLTADGRVVLVATPGHTVAHASVIAIDDDGRHLLLAGDATDTLEQLHARRADAIAPDPAVQVQTIDRILDHASRHPTVYLPSHDPDSVQRLAERTLVDAG